jgi:hypothetical protein
VDLGWIGGDPDDDSVTYDVYLEASDVTPDVLVCDDVSILLCDPGTLGTATQYYWQVVARDEHGATTTGPVWDFTTTSPPNTPSSPSPANGASGQSVYVDLSWTGGDPDGDAVTYDVYLEASDSTPDDVVCGDVSIPLCDPGPLWHSSHFYWYVAATDSHGVTTTGPIWDFTTEMLDQNQTAINYGFWFDDEVIRWQEFKPTLETLTSLDVYVARHGNPGDVIIEVKNLQGDTLGQKTISQANVPTPGSWLRCEFIPAIALSPGVKYRIYVYSNQDRPSPDDYYSWRGSTESTYDSDCANDAIEGWPNYDYAFITYGVTTATGASLPEWGAQEPIDPAVYHPRFPRGWPEPR